MKLFGHRHSVRLKKYDYSDAGWYFVTICTKDMECLFGDTINDQIILNEFGNIIQQYWLIIQKHFNIVELDDYVIMPNHIHGIIVIRNQKPFVGAGFPRPLSTLGQIIGYFKYQSTKQINILVKGSGNPTPTKQHIIKQIFQRSFYDHVIRTEQDLFRIRQYIRDNPKNWDEDENNLKSKGGETTWILNNSQHSQNLN